MKYMRKGKWTTKVIKVEKSSYRYRDDYELIYLINQNDEQALEEMIAKYRRILLIYINQFRYILKKEFDEDELLQISFIALYTAVKSFNESLGYKFTTYLRVVVVRELKLYVRSLHSLCRKANLEALSLHQTIQEEDDRYFIELIENNQISYETKYSFYRKEFIEHVDAVVRMCKEKDQKIFRLWQIGMSYQEIAEISSCTTKEVDNSIQRIKKKLRSVIDYNNAL